MNFLDKVVKMAVEVYELEEMNFVCKYVFK